METKPTTTIKLLLTGAFIALATSVFGQSIKVEQYETSSGQTFLVEYGSFFSLANSARLCQQDSVKLTAVGFSGTISWTKPDNSTVNGSSIWVKQSGTYSVSDGTNTVSTSLSLSSFAPEIYSNEYPVSETGAEFDVDDTTASTTGGFIPLFQSNNKQQWLTPESRQSPYSKMQFMITADELTEFGFEEGTTLNEIGFNYTDDYDECSSSGHNFQIRVYEVLDTTLSAFESSNSNPLGSLSCGSRSKGWNYFGIGNYEWNGTSTLVFEFDGYTYSGVTSPNPEIQIKQTPSNRSVVSVYPQSITSSTPSYSIDYRPLVSFKYKRPARQDSIIICDSNTDLYVTESATSYLWSSSSNSQISTDNYLSSHNTGGILYLTTSQSGSLCKYVDTVDVVFNTLPIPSIIATSTDFCEGETVTLSASSATTVDFVWSNGVKGSTTIISHGGDYTVTSTDQFGCSKTSLTQEITRIDKPVLLKSEAAQAPYSEKTHDLLAEDGTTRKINSLEYLFDFGDKKYFVSKYKNDSTHYVDVVLSNSLAEIGVIQSDAINDVFMTAHEEKYNQNSSIYPSRIFTGARWDYVNSTPIWFNGSTSNYIDYPTPSNNNYYFYHYYNSSDWWWRSNYTTSTSYGALIAYNNSDLYIQNGDVVCDSIELFAPTSFASYLWSTGDTTQSIWVSGAGSHSISLTGTYVKSDGSSCSLTSDTFTFTINASPSLTLTNNLGTEDLDGSNTIELEASYTSGSTISWSTGATADSIFVTSAGEYTATIELNGCSTTKTVNIYEPIFVDDDGSDITGTGTLANPYETLAKGLTEVTSGGKVYVLPGTYTETVNITKNVFIASDYYRLGDSAALHSTIIDGEGQRRLVNYDNTTETLDSSKSKIVGFTMTDGFEDNDEGAGIYGGWNVNGTTQIKNCLLKDISRECCASGIVLGWMSYNAHLIMDSVFVIDIGQANYGDQRRAFYLYNGQLTLKNSVVENTKHDNSLFSLENSSVLNLENVRITDVHENYTDNGSVFYLNSSSKAHLNHVTIDNVLLDSRYIARILSNNVTFHVINSVIDNADGRFLRDQSSGVAEVEIHNSVIGNGESGYTGGYLTSLPGVGQDGSLADNSEAIGYASANVLVGSKKYTSPTKDVTGKLRPAPTGTSPDAGAYESDKAQGDFDVLLTQCGYLLEANVLNSSAYSVEWLLNSQVVSTSGSWVTSSKGLYTVNVYSIDRSDTITKTINLSNPLEFEIFTSKDICTEVSSNNGEITYGNVSGGTQFNHNDWWSYRGGLTGIDNSYQNTNYFQSNNSHEGSYNLNAGTYYVYVEDGLGCQVGDTITLVDQDYARYYVSTTGDDSNDGKSELAAFQTIEHALTKVCDLDQVVVLDGLYQEDSLIVNRQVVIGSKYLVDNDTSHIRDTRIKGSEKSIFYYATDRSSWSDTATSQLVGLTLLPGKSSNYNEAASVSQKEQSVLKLRNVVIDSASNSGYSGIRWSDSPLAIENMSVTNAVDQTSPLIYTSYSSVDINGLQFLNNNGYRLIEVRYAHLVNLANIQALDNYLTSSAFYVYYPFSNFDIENVIIKGNRFYSAFDLYYGSSNEEGWISNALIVNNQVTSGSALRSYQYRGNLYLSHNTIADNYQSTSTPVRSLYHSADQNYSGTSIKVFGNILQGDGTSAIKVNDYSTFNVIGSNNLIEDGALFATNSITATVNNQRFGILDFDEDYSPSKYSKALGGGSSSLTLGGTVFTSNSLDVYGNTRSNPLNSNPDIGAVESPLDTFEQGVIAVHDDNGFCETAAGSITVTTLNYSGTKTYTWTKSGDATWTRPTTDSIVTGLADGTYSIAVLDSLNSIIGDTTITISTRPTISITDLSQDALCFGNGDAELSFELSGGNPFAGSQYQYNIQYLDNPPLGVQVDSMGSTYYFQETISSSYRAGLYNNSYNVYQGDYYITVTDFDGCNVDDTITIGNQYELPVVSISTEANDGTSGLTTACIGSSIDLAVSATSISATSYTYKWSTQETTNEINADESGDYYVQVTDNLTCVKSDTVNIYFQDAPVVVIEDGTPPAYSGNNIAGIYGTSSTYIGQYGENYYYYIDSYKTWPEAKQIAEDLGGRLPIIEDYSHNYWLAQNIRDNVSNHNDPWIGVYYDGSDWVDVSGNSLNFSYWWGSQSNQPYDQPFTTYKYGYIGYWGDWYNNYQYNTRPIVVEFAPSDLPLANNMSFCDSIELKANTLLDFSQGTGLVSVQDQGFTQIYWKDGNGTVLDSGEYVTFDQTGTIQLEGVFTRNDGSTCNLSSDLVSFTINQSPNLKIVAVDSTYDYAGDTLRFYAYSDSTNASVQWTHDTSLDTLKVTGAGTWTATASLNGCIVSKEVFIEEPIYVAKTGSNVTGTGSLTNPYKTIQFAIDTANVGQKIYVLPGTYSENLVLDKQLRIFSNYERLGDASAISATQISGSNTGPVFTFQGEYYDNNGNWHQGPKWSKDSTIISGFTIRNGYGNGNTGGGFQSQSNYNALSGILVKNAVVRNNTNTCCNDGIVAQMDMPLHFENVTVRNNGSPTNYDERTLFAFYHNKETVWKNVKFFSNEAQNHLIRLTDNQTFIVENSLFHDNIITDNEQALFGLDGNVTLVLNHTTIENSSGQGYAIKFDNSWGNQEVVLFNSIIGPHTKGSIHTTSSIQKVYAHNSVISSANGAFHGSGSYLKSGNTIEAPTMGIGANHKLTANSPALGIGGNDTTLAGISLIVPEFDLAGFSRPLPAGSNPDAGAYEDSLQRGNFDMYLDQCGLLVWASTVNGGSYQLIWMNGQDTLSNSDSAFIPSVGSYTVVGYSEYGDTLSKSISVTNPLSIELFSVKDACVDISQYSGTIKFDSPEGGSPYGSSYWYEYVTNLTGANDTNGYSNRQEWHDYQQPEFTGLAPGEYLFELSDASGCSVYDTVSIGSKFGQTVYVAVNGDDLNDGSEFSPLATINEALSRLCDGDSVIIEAGTYYENVVMPDELASVRIMSRFGLNPSDSSIIDQTIINGDADGRVIDIFTNYSSNFNSDTVSIIGLTIKNGYVSNYSYGGGIAVRYRTLDLRSSKIIGNEAYYGGGIGAYSASLLLTDVDITNNTSSYRGGGIYTSSSIYNYLIDDVVIENNTAQDGGGIYLYNYFWTSSNYEDEFSNFVIRNNTATSNGGGVYAYLSNSGRVISWKNWLVTGNVAENEGGAVYMDGYNSSAELHVVNSIFYGNQASNTPGIYVEGGDVNFIHSTIAGNSEKSNAWGIYKNTQLRANSNAEVQLWNTIIAGDRTESYQIVLYDQNSLTSHMSLVDGGNSVIYLEQDTANGYQSGNTYTGLTSSNFVDGPFTFVDAGNEDFTPSGNTSAIGVGLTSFTGPVFPVFDFNGVIRPDSVGTQPDLGAIESDLSSPEFGIGFTVVDNTACANSIATVQALAQQGSAPYDYYFVSLNPTQNPISGTSSFTNKSANQPVTIANLFSGVYGCYAVDSNGDSTYAEVEVQQADSVNIFIDKTPIFCAGDADGELTATVIGGNGQYAVNWIYPNQNSVSSYAINNLDTGVYTFTVTSDGCIYTVSDTITEVNQLSPLAITSSINKAGTIVLDDSDVRMCIGDEVTFDAGSGYISYLWETQDGYNSQNTQTINESGSKNYFLTALDTNGCYNYDTAKVYVVYEPNVFASNVNVVSSAQTPQVTSYMLGDQENPDNFYYYNWNIPKPYGSNYKKGRTQFIISASELQSAGLTENTTINSLGLEVESAGSIVQQFEIRMSHTTQQQLTYYENNLDLVYQVAAFTPTDGWVTHNLNTPWAWDGVNNIVVDVQFDNFNYGAMTRVKLNKMNSGITLTLSEYDNNSLYGSTNSSEWRPNVRFGIDKVEVADTIRVCDFSVLNTTDDYDQYQWYVNGVADTTTISKYLDQPADIFLLAVDAASQCYMYSDTFNVALDTTPVVDIVLSNSVICIGDTVFADAGSGYASYSWTDGSKDRIAQLFSSGTYIVSASSSNGCPGYDTVNVVVNTPPDLLVELNGEVLTSTDSDAKAGNSGCTVVNLLPYVNNFDDSLVVWNQSVDDDLDWIANMGPTDTDFSGPSNDTIRNTGDSLGTYFFINRAGANSDDNKVAYLTSDCIDLLGAQSPFVEFYYHMYDGYASILNIDQMGDLEIQVRDVSQGTNYWITVFSKSGNQGNNWYKGYIDLSSFVGTTVQLRVKGTAGIGGPRSEMAVDGFSILDTTISGSNVVVNNGRTPYDRVCAGDKLYAKALIDDNDFSGAMSFLWSDGRTGNYITLDSTGWYSVIMTDTTNCELVSDSVFIDVSPAPNNLLVFSDVLTYCEGDFSGLTIAVQDSSNASYEWFKNIQSGFSQGTGTNVYSTDFGLNITSASVGLETYVLKVTDSVGCVAFSDVAELVINPTPDLSLTENQVLCYGESNGGVNLDVIGSGGYQYSWSTGDTTQNIDSLEIGTYTVTVVDSFLCESIDSITVSQPSLFTYTVTDVEDVKCFDGNDGMATYNVGGGVGNYSYAWTDSTGTWTSTGKDLEFAPIGTYYVSAQDSNGCEILDTVRIEQPNELVLTLDSTKNLDCYQSSDGAVWATVVGGIGGNEYRLNGVTVADVDIDQLSAGFYTLVVEDDNGCMDSVTFTLTEPQLLTATNYTSQYVGGYEISCNGNTDGFIQVDVNGGTLPYTYEWTDSVMTEDRSNLGVGNYSLKVTDIMGCEVFTSAVLTEPTQVVASSTLQELYCFGDSTASLTYNVNGGVGPYVTNWASSNGVAPDSVNVTFQVDLRGTSPDASGIRLIRNGGGSFTMNTVSVLNDTIYRVTLTMAPGEQIMYRFFNGSAAETVNPSCGINNSVSVIERTFTAGTNDTSLAVVGFSECSTYGGARSGAYIDASRSIVGLASDVYYQTFTDMNGCSITLVDTVVEPAPLVLTLDSLSNVTCKNADDASVSVTVTGGNGNYSYSWNGVSATSEDLTNVAAGTYTLVVVDDKGCTDSLSVTVTEPDSLLASYVLSAYVGGNNVSCNGATDGSFDVSVQGGTLPYSYAWNTSDTTEDLSSIGQGYYSVVITDDNGCSVTVGDSIVEPNILTATIATTDVSCNGGTDGTVSVNVAGGSGPYTINWAASNGGQINSAMGVTFRVDMSNETLDPSGVDVVLGTGQILDMVTYDDSIYYATGYFNTGDSIKYRFFNGSASEVVPVNCGITQNLTLFERLLVVANDTTLPATVFSSCAASNPGVSGYAINVTDSLNSVTAGTYTATVTDANGCTFSVQDSVNQPDVLVIAQDTLLDASCPQTPDGYIGVTVTGGTGNYNFDWSNGDTTQNVTVGYGYHDLVVTDENGCQDSATFFVDAPFPYNDEEICVVTVDSTGVNMLVWEKTPGQKTASYEIFRENASTQYVSVGSNQYNTMSTWADQNSNPAVQPYRYKIAVVDSCGNYSDTSDYHATIHLQASQGVAANEVNLQWTAYEGKQVQTYYIYRWLSPINRVLIDSVSSNVQTYTDIYPVNTTITALLYEVGAKFTNGGCSPSAGKQSSYVTSMSNMLDWGQDGGLPIGTEEWVDVVLNNDLSIFPNPTLGRLNLEFKGAWDQQSDIRIKVVDITGRILGSDVADGTGIVSFDFTELPAGIYFINIITEEGRTIVKRFERIN